VVKKWNNPLLAFFFFIFFCIYISACTDKSHKIHVAIKPDHIKANQPFRLMLDISGPRLPHLKSNTEIPTLQTNDFTVEGVGAYNLSMKKDGEESFSQSYTFILVPEKSGDFVVAPWQVVVDNNEKYTTDAIHIHVYDDRMTSKDSLNEMKVLKLVVSPQDALKEYPNILSTRHN
jgi:hypothetical protein